MSHFLAVYDAGTFSGAAKAVGLSQQALSKSIARLEQQFGVRLFERNGSGARPTAFAELYLPHARAIFSEGERFRVQLRDSLGHGQGVIRIGVGPTAAGGVVAEAVVKLSARHPRVRVNVTAGLYEAMCEDLAAGRLDMVVGNRLLPTSDTLIAEAELGTVRYVAVASPHHPLAIRPELSLADLASADWVTGTVAGDVSRAFFESCRIAGIAPPQPLIETTSMLFTLSLLRAGRHVGIMPFEVVAGDIVAGRLVDLGIDAWSRPLMMAYRPATTWLPILSELMEGLRSVAQKRHHKFMNTQASASPGLAPEKS